MKTRRATLLRAYSESDLLGALLVMYWRGGVDQAAAAKLVGIRKDEFADLAALRKCVLIVEAAVWRYYLARFNHAFPECDRMAVMHKPAHTEPRSYTDDELMTVPNSGTEKRRFGAEWK